VSKTSSDGDAAEHHYRQELRGLHG